MAVQFTLVLKGLIAMSRLAWPVGLAGRDMRSQRRSRRRRRRRRRSALRRAISTVATAATARRSMRRRRCVRTACGGAGSRAKTWQCVAHAAVAVARCARADEAGLVADQQTRRAYKRGPVEVARRAVPVRRCGGIATASVCLRNHLFVSARVRTFVRAICIPVPVLMRFIASSVECVATASTVFVKADWRLRAGRSTASRTARECRRPMRRRAKLPSGRVYLRARCRFVRWARVRTSAARRCAPQYRPLVVAREYDTPLPRHTVGRHQQHRNLFWVAFDRCGRAALVGSENIRA